MDALSCGWDHATFLIFSDNVFAPLIYYSHLGPIIASLLIGILVLFANPRALVNRALFAFTVFFSIWVYFDLVLWASENISYVMFFWSAIVPIELLIYTSALYLVYLFANEGKDVSILVKLVASAFFIPIVLLAHTHYNLLGFDLTNCDREAIEGPLIQYLYLIEIIFIGWAAIVAIRGYRKIKNQIARRQLLYVSFGTILMMALFTSGNLIVTYFLDLDWSVEQYKLIGMPIFVAFVAYSMVRFQTFNSKLIAAQALVAALAISVVSLLFLNTITNVRIIAGITTVLVIILGYILVRSVRREIEQRQRVQKLATELEETNKRQESLIHFVGHEVKGYLTKDMSAFAALAEGDMGQLPDGMKPFVESALASSRDGARSVIDILQASNQKKGTVEYKKEPFDLAALVKEWFEKLKPLADGKGLQFTLSIDEAGAPYTVIGDGAQTGDHVLRNLIENSINYTPSGSVSITLKKKDGKILFSIADTGVGISDEDKKRLFTEGGKGKNSLKVNVHSTGYGLFIAKNIVEAEGGTIRAESEGSGKGSRFIAELPAA